MADDTDNTLFRFEHSWARLVQHSDDKVLLEWFVHQHQMVRMIIKIKDSQKLYQNTQTLRACSERLEQLAKGGWLIQGFEGGSRGLSSGVQLQCPLTLQTLDLLWTYTPWTNTAVDAHPIRTLKHLQRLQQALESYPDSPDLASGKELPQGAPGSLEDFLAHLKVPCEIVYNDTTYAVVSRRATSGNRFSPKRLQYCFMNILVYQDDQWKIVTRAKQRSDKRLHKRVFHTLRLLQKIDPDNLVVDSQAATFQIHYDNFVGNYCIDCWRGINLLINELTKDSKTAAQQQENILSEAKSLHPVVAAVVQVQREEPPLIAHRQVAATGRNPLPDDFGEETV